MLVRKAEVLPIEAIVRGYLTGMCDYHHDAILMGKGFILEGSASAEYRISRTVHGIRLPDRLRESEKLPQALFTPSTKAAPGMHDHNIHPNEGAPSPLFQPLTMVWFFLSLMESDSLSTCYLLLDRKLENPVFSRRFAGLTSGWTCRSFICRALHPCCPIYHLTRRNSSRH